MRGLGPERIIVGYLISGVVSLEQAKIHVNISIMPSDTGNVFRFSAITPEYVVVCPDPVCIANPFLQ
jgi:hypothetical protein